MITRALVVLVVFVAWNVPTWGQEYMTPELLWQLRRVSAPAPSPDGRTAVFTITEFDRVENQARTELYRIPVDGGTPERLTDAGRVANPQWRPDARKIGFLSLKDDAMQLWEIDPDGSNLRQVTDLEGGVANFRYAPDGAHISFTRRVKLDQTAQEMYPDLPRANARIFDELMYRHWDAWRDHRYSHLFIAEYRDGTIGEPRDLMPDERFDTPLPPFGGVEQIAWSPDATRIAYTAKKVAGTEAARSTDADVYIFELATGRTINLTESRRGYDVEPVFSPDGGRIVWLSMERPGYEADRNRLVLHEFSSGTSRELTGGFDGDAHGPAWSPDGQTVFFTSETQGTIQLFQVSTINGDVRQITEGTHDYGGVAVAAGERPTLVASRTSMSDPADLFRVDPASGEAVRLTEVNADLVGPVTLGRVERRLVTATDGVELLTWVIYPPDFDSAQRYPALLYAQGGPQSPLSQFFSYRWNFQTLAAQGYIIVAPNRRGVPGFGQEFKEAVSRDWGGQAMRDLLSAIDDVAAEPYVDGDRLGAIGPSFGGYSVFWLAGNHDARFRTFVAHAGVFNLESMYGTTEELFFVDFELGGPYWATPRPPDYDFSPHRFVQNWDTPMLVIHGERDYRVPVAEGMQAFTALQVQGIESRFLYFPEEGHWILTPQNGILWHRVVFEWLARYLEPGIRPRSEEQEAPAGVTR